MPIFKTHASATDTAPRHLAIVPGDESRLGDRSTARQAQEYVAALSATINGCLESGITHLSLLITEQAAQASHSSEILAALTQFVATQGQALAQRGVRLGHAGPENTESAPVVKALNEAARQCITTPKLRVTLAFNYDGRAEVAAALRTLALQAASGTLSPSAIDNDRIQASLSTQALPPVDFLIQTAPQTRLSHFLLWQAAYAELLFSPVPWTQFSAAQLQEALRDYSQRERKFGALPKDAQRS